MSKNGNPDESTDAMEELKPNPAHSAAPVVNTPQPTQVIAPRHTVSTANNRTSTHDGLLPEDQHDEAMTIKFAIGKLNDYISWTMWVLESLIALRFFLKLLGADPATPFAGFVITITNMLMVPFAGILSTLTFGRNQEFELPALIAILVYFLIFFALRRFLHILISSPEEPVE
jgi:hypothetical protein